MSFVLARIARLRARSFQPSTKFMFLICSTTGPDCQQKNLRLHGSVAGALPPETFRPGSGLSTRKRPVVFSLRQGLWDQSLFDQWFGPVSPTEGDKFSNNVIRAGVARFNPGPVASWLHSSSVLQSHCTFRCYACLIVMQAENFGKAHHETQCEQRGVRRVVLATFPCYRTASDFRVGRWRQSCCRASTIGCQ